MKRMAHGRSVLRGSLISPAACAHILAELKAVPEPYWYRRTNLQHGRGVAGATCDYWWLTPAGMPKNISDLLIQHAPRVEGLELSEWIVNRYLPGQYMGKHRDRDPIPYNAVIPLQALGDGLQLEDVFYPDEVGVGTVFEGPTDVHEVPPVKFERYVLVYLLTEK